MLIPSPKVETYDQKPEMSAIEVAQAVIKESQSGKHDGIILNFANCDMVGHTGDYEAAIKATETVDKCVKMVYNSVVKAKGICLITSDHGNADMMAENDGSPFTAHTTNDVPLILCKEGYSLKDGRLCDIAPTMLTLLGLPIPKDMTGTSLIV